MKRIGILTLHGANNFGAVLQNYALQKSINKLGYNCETIDYKIPQIDHEYKVLRFYRGKNPVKNIVGLYWDIRNKKQAKVSYQKFDEFRCRYISLSKEKYTLLNIGEAAYDLFIVGSDQVWNTRIIRKNNVDTFSLKFANSKKAAYAASCGNIDFFLPLDNIRGFDYITVREEPLSNYLADNGIRAEVVCDPTMLLSKKEWEMLIEETKINHYGYVYLYYIDSGKDSAAFIANDLAKKKGLKVYYSKRMDRDSQKNHYGINCFSDGPLDFIKEIACADCVVVSSFHGVVFSVLMEKNFIALLHESTGSRVYSLLNKIGLQDQIVKNIEDYQSREFPDIDYSTVRPIIEKWRQESMKQLKNICEL